MKDLKFLCKYIEEYWCTAFVSKNIYNNNLEQYAAVLGTVIAQFQCKVLKNFMKKPSFYFTYFVCD